MDTGIRYSHSDFGGRAVPGFDAFGGNGSDGNGHGTHVAGTAGGSAYGVAKKAALVSVKVLDANGSGTMADVVAGQPVHGQPQGLQHEPGRRRHPDPGQRGP